MCVYVRVRAFTGISMNSHSHIAKRDRAKHVNDYILGQKLAETRSLLIKKTSDCVLGVLFRAVYISRRLRWMPTDLSRCSAGRRLHPHSPPPALRCVRYLSSDVCPLCVGVIRRFTSVIVRPLGFRAIAAFMPRCTDGRGRLCRYRRPHSTVQRTGSSLFQTATTLVLTCRWFCRHFLWRFRDRTRSRRRPKNLCQSRKILTILPTPQW